MEKSHLYLHATEGLQIHDGQAYCGWMVRFTGGSHKYTRLIDKTMKKCPPPLTHRNIVGMFRVGVGEGRGQYHRGGREASRTIK